MTVEELIAKLKEEDPKSEVVMSRQTQHERFLLTISKAESESYPTSPNLTKIVVLS